MAVQIVANTGASSMIVSGLMLWNQLDGTMNEPMPRAVCLSANRFIDPPACSKPIQKNTENSVNVQMPMTRCHSGPVNVSSTTFSPEIRPGSQTAAAIAANASTPLAIAGKADTAGPMTSAA